MKIFTRAYVLAAGALVVLAAWTGANERWSALAWFLSCALGASAVAVGVRVRRPHDRSFWWAVGGALGCWSAAALLQLAGGPNVPASGYELSAALYLPGYVALAWSTLRLLRRVGVGRPETFDAAIGTALGLALLFPIVVDSVDRNGARIVWSMLFPVWDTLLALVLLRIVFSSWSRRRSLQVLAAAALVLLMSDLLYFSSAFLDSPVAARLFSASYTAAYLLFGAAALPRSMRRIPPRALPHERSRLARRRTVAVMGLALVATPVIFGVERAVHHDLDDFGLSAIGVVIVGLVVLRVWHLLRQSEQLRARAEDSERLFRTVFDAAGVGISVGVNGIMSQTNPALQRMLGYSGEELARMHYTEIIHPDDVQVTADAVEGVTKTFERRMVARDGREVWVDVTLTKPARDRFGIAVMEDITAAKQLEDELRHAQKMEAVGQLAGGVAHDFNNLMTAVTGYAAMLQREIPVGDARRADVDSIAEAADRAAELTRKLLAFSRRQVLRLDARDLSSIVLRFDPFVRRLLPENIALEYDLEPGAVARVDRGELEQVLLNLAVNARDAMPAGGLLEIAVRTADGAVELAVRDDGTGMDEDTRFRIFDPFFTTKPVGQGTGLGLSTVDGIVAQLGGTIDVESELGAGTTFTIRLPLADDAAVEERPDPAALAPTASGASVLLVEDDDAVRHVTTEMLGMGGYEVVAAASAEEALTLLAAGAVPDVLVSDVVMTGMDGPTLAAHARELLPDLPVLFVSGYPTESLGDTTSETVLSKPFTPAKLAEHVELVRRAAIAA